VGCVPFDPDYACCDEWDSLPPELQERATALAWSTLRTLSGGRVGNCPVVVRPCLSAPCTLCAPWATQAAWMQAGVVAGEWVNCVCGCSGCTCRPLCEIVMPGEIALLAAVTQDGCELPVEDFRVDNGYRIVRMDGACFPSCQNLDAPLTECGTFSITYVPGIVPNEAALWAAGVLSCEFAKACTGANCRLPSSVTTIARQGVVMTMSAGMFSNGLTGIREVDAYLVSVNPNALRMPSSVWSPDVPWAKHRYVTPMPKVVSE